MPHVWSVSELTAALKRTLEATFPVVDLEGEVSGFKRYPSGHAYWTLKDADAQLSALMFRQNFDACKGGETIRDGVRLKVRGRITTGLRSQYQIIVTRARPCGQGELMQRFLALRAKLEAEGLFAAARKRPLPFLPRRIGLITSRAGAVIHDMCRVLIRRFPALEIRLFPAVVQGDAAPASVVAGLQYFNAQTDWRADLIIFGRGGGSFEDLFCFNDEQLVRAVAASQIPTISAVGHETDFTLADFVADVRAGTPSMAAELAVPEYAALLRTLTSAQATFASSLRNAYEWTAQRVDAFSSDLVHHLWRYETAASARLDAASSQLSLASAKLATTCAIYQQQLQQHASSLASLLNLSCVHATARVTELESKLSLLSPYSVLTRGYSLTTDANGRIVRDASEVREGDEIHTRLQNGAITSVVRAS